LGSEMCIRDRAVGWQDQEHPRQWVKVVQTFRDGPQADWWVLEVVTGPYGWPPMMMRPWNSTANSGQPRVSSRSAWLRCVGPLPGLDAKKGLMTVCGRPHSLGGGSNGAKMAHS